MQILTIVKSVGDAGGRIVFVEFFFGFCNDFREFVDGLFDARLDGLVVGDFLRLIYDAEVEPDVGLLDGGEEGLFVETVSLADKTLDSIAVYGVLEEMLAHRYEHLARRAALVIVDTVMHAQRIRPKQASASEKLFDAYNAFELFLPRETVFFSQGD